MGLPAEDFAVELAALAVSAEWTGIASYRPSGPFDEIPLFGRDADVAFLGDRPTREKNRLLVRFAARFLAGVPGESPPRYLRMISLTEWSDYRDDGSLVCSDGSELLLVPRFWIGDLTHPDMRSFEISAGASACARFVESALGPGDEFAVYENFGPRDVEIPARVYVSSAVTAACAFEASGASPVITSVYTNDSPIRTSR